MCRLPPASVPRRTQGALATGLGSVSSASRWVSLTRFGGWSKSWPQRPQRRLPPYQTGGRLLQRWMVGVMNHQRLVNLLVSNLPGPPARLTFAGAPVLEMFQVGLVHGNLAIGVGVLSYAGQLTFDVVSGAAVIPDVHSFTDGIAETRQDLGATKAPASDPTA
jgi:hypothetical protein